jgi:predicted nucleic acid-binding protein
VNGYTLDSGAVIAVERGNGPIHRLIERAIKDTPIALPTTVLAQTWRGTPRQAHVARLLLKARDNVTIVDLDRAEAIKVGLAIGCSGHCDVVDVHTALTAQARGHAVITSDPHDLARVDPDLLIVQV